MIGIARRRIPLLTGGESEYVDLGLPSGLLWARGNIVKDAQGNYSIGNETDYGCYFSWGNIIGHNNGEGYDFGALYSGPYPSTPGASVNTDISPTDAAHDAALVCLGTPWHLPTKEDFQELYANTDREWTTIKGINGRKFMKKNDHTIYVFFPAAGNGSSTNINNIGECGYYWSSSWRNNISANNMMFNSSAMYPQDYEHRFNGFSVRAVRSA